MVVAGLGVVVVVVAGLGVVVVVVAGLGLYSSGSVAASGADAAASTYQEQLQLHIILIYT